MIHFEADEFGTRRMGEEDRETELCRWGLESCWDHAAVWVGHKPMCVKHAGMRIAANLYDRVFDLGIDFETFPASTQGRDERSGDTGEALGGGRQEPNPSPLRPFDFDSEFARGFDQFDYEQPGLD